MFEKKFVVGGPLLVWEKAQQSREHLTTDFVVNSEDLLEDTRGGPECPVHGDPGNITEACKICIGQTENEDTTWVIRSRVT